MNRTHPCTCKSTSVAMASRPLGRRGQPLGTVAGDGPLEALESQERGDQSNVPLVSDLLERPLGDSAQPHVAR